MKSIALLLITTGVLLITAGLLFLLADKLPWLGNLPGDIHIKFKNFRIHLPVMTCILISLVLTILLNIILRFLGK